MNENIKATSVSEVVNLITSEFKNLKDENDFLNLWFRAENLNVSTPLVPNAYRKFVHLRRKGSLEHAKSIENELTVSFLRQSIMYLNQNRINPNEWNIYFLMQHYGLKTRLLDWTESALIALYFGLKNQENEEDTRLWILSPLRLNRNSSKILFEPINKSFMSVYFPEYSKSKNLITDKNQIDLDELHRRYLQMDFSKDESNISNKFYPLAILPYLFDERMKTQQACFTIFGNEMNGLLDSPDKDSFLSSVIIEGKDKKNMLEELRWLGITEQNIYPGLDGICKGLNQLFK
jgi:hypothetical protein